MKLFIEAKDSLIGNFTFKNFQKAIDFVNQVADLAEQQNHQPDILIHDYNKVRISIATHDTGNSITAKDWHLADSIEKLSL